MIDRPLTVKEAELFEAGAAAEAPRVAANPNPALTALLGALEPFATYSRALPTEWRDDLCVIAVGGERLTVNDFRQAEQALADYRKASQS